MPLAETLAAVDEEEPHPFEIRIVSQPGIARRFDDAFCRAVIGDRSSGSRKSTYVQEIRFPASSTWCPSARY